MNEWVEFTSTDESKVLFRCSAIVRVAPSMYAEGRMGIYEFGGICTPVLETYDEIKARLMYPHG